MKIFRILSICLGLTFTVILVKPVHAAVFDCLAGDVDCLIDAINTGNANGEEDTINLEAGTYTLTAVDNMSDGPNGLPLITSKITIQGTGAENSVIKRADSAPSFRIFNIPDSNGILTLEGLSISGGQISEKGGGILNKGNTTIAMSKVSHNSADIGGGIFNNGGTLTVRNSVIAENTTNEDGYCNRGGGIDNGDHCGTAPGGTVEITESTICKNTAGVGGGIYNLEDGELIIKNSTIDQNEAVDSGGGGIDSDGVLTVENSTISRNNGAWAGGMVVVGVKITNSTIMDNEGGDGTGGIRKFGTGIVELRNSIVANNSSGGDCFGGITSLDYNLDSDGTCNLTQPNDLPNTDPLLGEFTDDGAPGRGHFPLLKGSPAIDRGDDVACPPTDQLGNPRVDGDGDSIIVCDIGAIEFQVQTKGNGDGGGGGRFG